MSANFYVYSFSKEWLIYETLMTTLKKKNRFNNLVTPGYINTYKATNHIKAYHTRFHLPQAVVGAKGLVNIYRSKCYRRKLCPAIEFLGGGPGKRVHFHGNEAIPLGL